MVRIDTQEFYTNLQSITDDAEQLQYLKSTMEEPENKDLDYYTKDTLMISV